MPIIIWAICKRPGRSSPAPFANTPLGGFALLRSSFLLIEWRSLRSFPRTDSHASMESVLRKLRVNCKKNKNKKFKKVVDILELFLYNESCVTDEAF